MADTFPNLERPRTGQPPSRARLGAFLVSLALAAGVLVLAPPASALSAAFFPTISKGNRGEDVRAAQYLLRHHGFHTGVSGVFDRDMKAIVEEFQRSVDLPKSGVIGARTWRKLVVRVKKEDEGPAVSAVQRLLVQKHDYNIDPDGSFGHRTMLSLKEFEDHMHIEANGIADRISWRNLLWHYVPVPDNSRTCVIGGLENAWGTGATTAQLRTAARIFGETDQGGVAVGHLSRIHGGYLSPHVSHQVGMDADLRPIRKGSDQCSSGASWQDDKYDRRGTRDFIEALNAAGPGKVIVIWFNDPRLAREGLVEPLSGHDDHLHVRWCVETHPDSNYDCENAQYYHDSAAPSQGLEEDGTEAGLYGANEEE